MDDIVLLVLCHTMECWCCVVDMMSGLASGIPYSLCGRTFSRQQIKVVVALKLVKCVRIT